MKKEKYALNNTQDQKYGTFTRFTMESPRSGSYTVRVFTDLITLSIFICFLALFYDYLIPFQRGFFCDDENIMYPVKKGSISNAALWSISVLLPTAVIVLTETLRHFSEMNPPDENEVYFCGWKVPYMFQRIYLTEGIFLFGIIMAEIAANFVKVLVGRPRPSFMELCKPDVNCSEIQNPHFFVQNYKCTNIELKDQNDPRLSFPSGHSAVSMFAMLYVVLYLQKRLYINFSSLLKPIIQLLALFLSIFISITRIQDNQHHWDDVIAGIILGVIICLIMVFSQTDIFKTEVAPHPHCSSEVSFPKTAKTEFQ